MTQTDALLRPSGSLVMLDGPDGVGKTTQVDMAKKALRSKGYTVFTTRLSGGTMIGEALRKVSLNPNLERSAQTDLYIILAMYSALAYELKLRLTKGNICLVDRSPLSIIAYQVYGSGLSMSVGQSHVSESLELFNPDLVVCYDAPRQTLDAHRKSRTSTANIDYFESQPVDFALRVIEGYREAAKLYDVRIVNAVASAADVHAKTMELIEQVISLS